MIAGSSLPARAAIVALLISVSACGTAPERSAAVPAKRYPWDRRTTDCFEGAALRQIPKHCQAPEWSDFAEAKEHFESLFFVEPGYKPVERAATKLAFPKRGSPAANTISKRSTSPWWNASSSLVYGARRVLKRGQRLMAEKVMPSLLKRSFITDMPLVCAPSAPPAPLAQRRGSCTTP